MPHVGIERDYASWRTAARALLADDVLPADVSWHETSSAQGSLLPVGAHDVALKSTSRHTVPRAFLELAPSVACHADGGRWDALYRVLFRLTHGELSLLDVATDPDVHRVMAMHRAVRRAVHKMHAFVRFRAVDSRDSAAVNDAGRDAQNRVTYVAWFEPVHHVVQRAVPLFTRRFPAMHWSILTPLECAHWDGVTVRFTPGVSRALAPTEDKLEELWQSYYAHIFNPARVSLSAMQAEMPRQYWTNLPEARLIATLAREAPRRVARMLAQLQEPAAELPAALRSRVGVVTVPERALVPSAGDITNGLDAPGVWDPLHDPGVAAARARAQAARAVSRSTDGAGQVVQGTPSVRMTSLAHVTSSVQVTSLVRVTPSVQVTPSVPLAPSMHGTPSALQAPGVQPIVVGDTPVRIGTASWTDPTLLHAGVFYPDGVTTPEARLQYYASRYSLVEVDSTYYVPPTRAMAAAWASRSPQGFVFDIKAFALMTGHAAETKRLPDWLRRRLPRSTARALRVEARELNSAVVDDVWARFLAALAPLRDAGKLGPILLQFPRWFTPSRANADVLRVARKRLGDAAAAVEFRNPAWVTGRVAARTVALLETLQLTYVNVDAPPGTSSSMPPVLHVTTPELSVVRLHGRRAAAWEAKHRVVSERYRYLYDTSELRGWTLRIGELASRLRDVHHDFPDMAKARQGVHVVFNNCHANYGTTNTDEITALLIEFDKQRVGVKAQAGPNSDLNSQHTTVPCART